ncbi:hypothetical protein BGM19_12835 [Streptomyces agglomeratus]|uniref:hypothetical protein n=1 Tax=Streptomyces TaxID=1883 RepID=UPI00086F3EB1|nr:MULTISPECIES: hypothetical protein [Streptomyces]OEJ58749.1 hypothetical protein BGM19_12835 [Streptomyces agglomeratus]
MTPPRANDPAAIAIGLLLFGGGALLLASLFGIWTAFSLVVLVAFGIAVSVEARQRRIARRWREEQEWRRILRDEWGYFGE